MTMFVAHDIDAEQAVLGACLLDEKAIYVVEPILPDPSAFNTKHAIIWKAMLELKNAGDPIDIVSIISRLQDSGEITEIVGGVSYLVQLQESCPTAANADFYADRVKKKYIARSARHVFEESSAAIEANESPDQVMEVVENRMRELAGQRQKNFFVPVKDVLLDTFERIEHKVNGGGLSGIPSDYPDLDKMTNGFQRSDLIIVAARPSVGKTAFALNVAQNVAKKGEPVGIFSLEMAREQLVQRMLCAEANIDAGKMRTGMLDEYDWPKLTMAVGTLSEAPIFIDDSAALTVNEIRAKCRRLKEMCGGLGLIMIDYLQLIAGDKRLVREQQVSEISRTLKMIARELNVPVIALSQLSRNVESRQDKRPMMSDLRESGSIEQDADIVSFLYRDDYYNPESECKNIVELIIGKQRNGPTGTVELVFLKQFNKFVSLERHPCA